MDTRELSFPVHRSAYSVRWSPRPDTRGLLNLKSCEMQLSTADQLLAETIAELRPADFSRYPYHRVFVDRLAELNSVNPDHIMLSAGSNAAIATVVDAFAAPAGRIILQEPAFDSWAYFASLRGIATTHCAGLTGTPPALTTVALEEEMRARPPSVVAITNPGNPTGFTLPLHDMRKLGDIAADNGHVLVVDECYGAFSDTSHVPLIEDGGHVVVIRSLSKSWALAGGRLAVTFGAPRVIDYLRRFATDSAVSTPVLAIALGLSRNLDRLRSIWAEVRSIRDEFAELVTAGHPAWVALPSGANFVTFHTGESGGGTKVEAFLAARDVRVRSVEDKHGLAACVRFSLADRETMHWLAGQLGDGGA